MTPFDINFNQVLALINPSIVLQSNFCILFTQKKQFFALYRTRTSSPIMCMHIPTGIHYPAYQVFYFLSDTLSFENFKEQHHLEELPNVEEINSIFETISKEEIFRFSFGLRAPSSKNITELSQANQHLLNVAQTAPETVDFELPVYINRDYSLSFVFNQGCHNIPDSLQICDFSEKDSVTRFSHTGGSWIAPGFNHQKYFLVSFSPISFLQYFSEHSLIDERAVIFSPEFSQIEIYNSFFPMLIDQEYPKVVLLHSKDIQESINNIRFILYFFNYFTNITTSFNLTSNHLEITFVFDKKEEHSLIFSKFFNGIRSTIRKILSITSESDIDENFFQLFRPYVASDNSRYPDLEKDPVNPKDDTYICIPIKEETILALLTEMPNLFNLLFNDPNYSFDLELFNPFSK